eukprot:m.502521 g.502521  ORF g.502521 m.502521 type:complete len:359 (+) comp21843_c0_seq6:1426-2502(+)
MFESGRICVCTAYTTNYMPGFLCEDVNKSYAVRHGYDFVSRCLSPLAMMTNIFPRGHGTWYKVRLLNELLVLKEGSSTRKKYDVIVWIDGDACVVKPERRIEQYFAKASDTTDLIVGEDMTPACLVNAGVLLIRNTDWSQRLWQDVWQSEQFTKWHDKCFHEQSALCKWLKTHEEGFGSVVPWFSYKGGPKERNTKHVCVLPHHDLNTNGGSLEFQKCRSMSKQAREESLTAAVSGGPQFIFHAVGCSNKLDALVSKIRQAGLELPIGRITDSRSSCDHLMALHEQPLPVDYQIGLYVFFKSARNVEFHDRFSIPILCALINGAFAPTHVAKISIVFLHSHEGEEADCGIQPEVVCRV